MVNIIIGTLIWQAIVTIIFALGKEKQAVKIGCGVWYILISCVVSVIDFYKKG